MFFKLRIIVQVKHQRTLKVQEVFLKAWCDSIKLKALLLPIVENISGKDERAQKERQSIQNEQHAERIRKSKIDNL